MLKVNHLFKSYQTGKITYEVLKDVCFEVEKGEFVAVMGASGSGKTTMLNCISCFHSYDKGEITLNGCNLSKLDETEIAKVRNEQLGFVFQDFMLLDGLTVFENVCVPKVIRNEDYQPMEQKAATLLKMFGIDHIADKYPAEISGGQKQRVAVARSLMNDPWVCQKICVSKLSENFLWTAWLTCSKCWKPVKVRGSAFTGFRHFDKIHHCSPEDLHT